MPGFDALTHLDSPVYDGVLDRIIDESRQAGIDGWLIAGADPACWTRVRAVALQTTSQWAVGAHPWWTADATEALLEHWMAELQALDPPVVGEIGLDHLRGGSDGQRSRQRQALRRQLDWARQKDRPVVLHCVRALPELLQVLRSDGLPPRGGLIHGWQFAADLVDDALTLGLHLSIGPGILRASAHKIRASASRIPPDRLLLETDCPDQAMPGTTPSGPADLRRVAQVVAACQGAPVQRIIDETGSAANALLHGVVDGSPASGH